MRCDVLSAIVLLVYLSIIGCAAAPTRPSVEQITDRKAVNELSERYRKKALEHEGRGDIKGTLLMLEVAVSLDPENTAAGERLAVLRKNAAGLSEEHLKKGISLYNGNSKEAARREFIMALYYNPDNADALDYLKNRLAGEDYTVYTTKQGDTLKGIAERVYNDPEKDFVIAFYNDLDRKADISPGILLRLPVLDIPGLKRSKDAGVSVTKLPDIKEVPAGKPPVMEVPAPVKEAVPEKAQEEEVPVKTDEMLIEEMLGRAEMLFEADKYMDVIPISHRVLEIDPGNSRAKELRNASYYKQGKMMLVIKKYQEAIRLFNSADPDYQDVRESKLTAERSLAEVHYITGVKYFVNDEIEQAIKEWEKALALYPEHPKAKNDVENARGLLMKLKQLK